MDTLDKWIEALRSGDYKQCSGTLCRPVAEDKPDEYAFCCLGVLAVTAGISKAEDMALKVDQVYWETEEGIVASYGGETYIYEDIGQKLEEFFGPMDGLPSGELSEFLQRCNDSGKSFNFIADKLEEFKASGVSTSTLSL